MKLKVLMTAALLMAICWGCSLFYSDYQKDLDAIDLAKEAVKHAAAGQKKEALFLLNIALNIAKTTRDEGGEGGFEYSNALSKIAIDYIESGFYDKAIVVANTIPDERTKLSTLSKIDLYHNITVRYDQAVALANTIKIDSTKSSFPPKNTPEENNKILQYEQDLAIAEKIEDGEQKVTQMVQIAVHFLNVNRTDKGLQVLEKAYNTTKFISNRDEDRALAVSEIAIIYVRLGEYDRALTVAKSIDNYNAVVKARTLNYIKKKQHSKMM